MLTKMQINTAKEMYQLGATDETIEAVLTLLKEHQPYHEKMRQMLRDRYEEKGKVTEQDMMKMVIMITCKKKNDTH